MRTIVLLLICMAAIGLGLPAKPSPASAASSALTNRPSSPLDDVEAAVREAAVEAWVEVAREVTAAAEKDYVQDCPACVAGTFKALPG